MLILQCCPSRRRVPWSWCSQMHCSTSAPYNPTQHHHTSHSRAIQSLSPESQLSIITITTYSCVETSQPDSLPLKPQSITVTITYQPSQSFVLASRRSHSLTSQHFRRVQVHINDGTPPSRRLCRALGCQGHHRHDGQNRWKQPQVCQLS